MHRVQYRCACRGRPGRKYLCDVGVSAELRQCSPLTFRVASPKHICREERDQATERGRKVVCRLYDPAEMGEFNILSIVGEDAYEGSASMRDQ